MPLEFILWGHAAKPRSDAIPEAHGLEVIRTTHLFGNGKHTTYKNGDIGDGLWLFYQHENKEIWINMVVVYYTKMMDIAKNDDDWEMVYDIGHYLQENIDYSNDD